MDDGPQERASTSADADAGTRPQRDDAPSLVDRAKAAPITFALAAINVAVFLWAEQIGDTTKTATLIQFGAVDPVLVWAGDYWRVASYMFLHIGWVHLLWNTYASVGWSTAVERALGKWRFLVVYLLSGIGGGCAAVIFQPAVTAGASGAMFGIVGATLAIRRRQLESFRAFWVDPPTRSVLISIAIWTVIGATALHMSHGAHFGGLLVGAAVTWLFITPRSRAGWLAFGVVFAALGINAARPWWVPQGDKAQLLAAYAEGYLQGKDWPLDKAKGERLAEKGCSRGVVDACVVLGVALDAHEDAPSRARALELFRSACASGSKDGCAAEGFALATGHGQPGDEERGRSAVHDACASGSAWACALEKSLTPAAAQQP